MLLQELKDRLHREGYDHRWFSFSSSDLPVEGYILEKQNPFWVVLYFERGETRQLASFESEFDACEWFYQRVSNSVQKRPHSS
jgi:hypothetical protein